MDSIVSDQLGHSTVPCPTSKVLMPDGSAFLLQEYKEKEESGPAQGAPENGRLVEPTDSSNNSIRSSSEESKTQFQERDELPTDRELLMAAKAEGRNAEALTAYQKKVRSLEALERKLKRQQDALEAARSRQATVGQGTVLCPGTGDGSLSHVPAP